MKAPFVRTALPTFLALATSAAHAQSIITEPGQLSATTDPLCQPTVIDFEDPSLSTGTVVGDFYATARGVRFGAGERGLLVRSTVVQTWGLVHDTRAGVIQVDPDVLLADDLSRAPATQLAMELRHPTAFVGAWFIDADGPLLLEAWYGSPTGQADETVTLDVESRPGAAARYAAVRFTNPVRYIVVHGRSPGDEFAVDDVELPPPHCWDEDGDGFPIIHDCADTDATRYPGAPELCNGRIDDCSGMTLPEREHDRNADGILDCIDADGDRLSYADGDCLEGDASIPATREQCNGRNDTCAPTLADDELDRDRDGLLACEECNDADPSIHPGAAERPNHIDDDCDGRIDEETVLSDDDGDGQSEVDGDCDDANAQRYRGAPEDLDNGIDDACTLMVDRGGPGRDDDGDGFCEGSPRLAGACLDGARPGDCDDTRAAVYPGAPETNDGRLNDCGGVEPATIGCSVAAPGQGELVALVLAVLAASRRRPSTRSSRGDSARPASRYPEHVVCPPMMADRGDVEAYIAKIISSGHFSADAAAVVDIASRERETASRSPLDPWKVRVHLELVHLLFNHRHAVLIPYITGVAKKRGMDTILDATDYDDVADIVVKYLERYLSWSDIEKTFDSVWKTAAKSRLVDRYNSRRLHQKKIAKLPGPQPNRPLEDVLDESIILGGIKSCEPHLLAFLLCMHGGGKTADCRQTCGVKLTLSEAMFLAIRFVTCNEDPKNNGSPFCCDQLKRASARYLIDEGDDHGAH